MGKEGSGTKLIRIKEETINRLGKIGKFNETFDELINRILDMVEKKK